MNGKTLSVFAFAAGAALGSLITWNVVKKKYERIAQEEINSVKEIFTVPKSAEPTEESEIELDYGEAEKNKKEGDENPLKPYVISPDEFGERDGYPTVSLTYYEDGILTDESDEIIRNIDDVVGEDSLLHFGEYEDDSVFVRNDDLKIDFEILRDVRKFKDVLESKPVRQLNWWDDDE